MNPTIGDNRRVYSPGDRVRTKDGSRKDGEVKLANDIYKKALVHWYDAEQHDTPDQWADYVQLEKYVEPKHDDSTVSGSPSSVVGVTGGGGGVAGTVMSEPFRPEGLDAARSRRRRVLEGGPLVVFDDPVPIYGGHPSLSGQPGGQPVSGPNDPMGQRPQQPPNLHVAVPQGDSQWLTDQLCASCRFWDPMNASEFPNADGPSAGARGGCTMYRVATGGQQVCDSWAGRAGYDLAIVVDDSPIDFLGLSEGVEGDRFTKVALRTGQLAAATPDGRGRTIDKPLVVVDGRTEYADDGSIAKIGMDDIIDSVNDGAFERVTVPLSHADRPEENQGYVTKAWKEDDPARPGEKQLVLEQVITEPDTAGKVKRKSIFGSSVGLVFDYVRKSDLKRFPVALKHNALTNVPWVRGLGDHAVALSEGEENFSVAGIPVRDVYNLELADNVHPLVRAGKALSDGKGGFRWPIRNASDLGNAKQAFGRAKPDERGSIRAWINKRARELGQPQLGQSASSASEPPQGGAINGNDPGGDRMAPEPDAAALALQLSEQRDIAKAQQEELNRLHTDLHRRNVDDRIKAWSSMGLDQLPGFLKTARQIMLQDDGGPAMVMQLSEDEGGGHQEVTASGIVERLVESLPLSEDGASFKLGQQLFTPEPAATSATRPPMRLSEVDPTATGSGFDNSEDAVEKRFEEARKELGIVNGIPSGGDA